MACSRLQRLKCMPVSTTSRAARNRNDCRNPARLVVDTGMHFKRWSREQAIAYLVDNTGYAGGRVEREIDRYCVWPGQACSYKVGHTVWTRLRDEARAKLGARFDIKDFHDAGLNMGGMPLTVLEGVIGAWAARA